MKKKRQSYLSEESEDEEYEDSDACDDENQD
jgi:hypothetical protein